MTGNKFKVYDDAGLMISGACLLHHSSRRLPVKLDSFSVAFLCFQVQVQHDTAPPGLCSERDPKLLDTSNK